MLNNVKMRFSPLQSLGLLLLLALVSGGPALAQLRPQPRPMPQPGANRTRLAVTSPAQAVSQSILDLTNQARRQANQGKLTLSESLSAAAQRHANDLAQGAPFSHQGSDGSTMVDRVKGAGYDYWSIAENIYYQSPSNRPERAVQGWLKSPGHRRNLLSGKFTEIGIGYASNGGRHFYVQVFGKPQ